MTKQADKTTTVAALVPDPYNRRKHTPRNLEMIAAALREVGASRSIVIDEKNEVLAGNGVIEAAAQAGISNVQIVDADGETIIAVRRSGLTDEQKRALALFDNRTAELAAWDVDQLKLDEAAGLDLKPFFFDNELATLLQTLPADGATAAGDDPREHWRAMPEFEQPDKMPWKRLIVNFKDAAALDAFMRLIDQTITARTSFIWYPAEPRAKVDEVYADADA